MNEKLLVPAIEAAKMLSMGRSTFWNKVKLAQLPQPVKVAGITRWRVSDLRRFVDNQFSQPDAAE
jgi:predicted DNA-binding transcriptional regulator AlpA